ncbi:MAG: hypothetical protein WCQ60_04130 [bacterium]
MTDSTNKAPDLIKAMMQNEELISKMYIENATLFPGDSKFWIAIAKDEMLHSSWLRELFEMVKQGSVAMESDRFNMESIVSFGAYVANQTNKIRAESASAIKALSISMDLENSLLESGIFKVYSSDDQEIKTILGRLQKSTEDHYSEIKERWSTERTNAGIK